MKKQPIKIAAVIDIGSSAVRMQIAQWNGEEILPLDRVEQAIHLGQEVFNIGQISFETVRKLSQILTSFLELAHEYGIKKVRTTATTAMREATNRLQVVNQIFLETHLEVEVLEDQEVNSLMFDVMLRDELTTDAKTLLVFAGTGITGLALCQDKQISFTHSLDMGMLKTASMLRAFTEETRHFDQAVQEYYLCNLSQLLGISDFSGIEHIYLNSGYVGLLHRLLQHDDQPTTHTISMSEMEQLYQSHQKMTLYQIASRYQLSEEESGAIYYILTLVHCLYQLLGCSVLSLSSARLTDATLSLLLLPEAKRIYNNTKTQGALRTALSTAMHYRCYYPHTLYVMQMADALFEALGKLHNFSPHQRLLLESACILSEIGNYTNTRNPSRTSADLVLNMQLYGLNKHEVFLIAGIISPDDILDLQSKDWNSVEYENDVLFISKMNALLRLACALDYSQQQKGQLQSTQLEKGILTIQMGVHEDYSLEKWIFEHQISYLEKSFGITTVLATEPVLPKEDEI